MAIYMNYNNKTPAGNVTAAGYEGWIELDSMDYGTGRSITMEAGAMSNREASRPNLSEIMISKTLDSASGGLHKASLSGDSGVKVEIHIVQTGADKVEKYAEYKFEEVMISSFASSASTNSRPMERISLSYAKMESDLTHADKTNKNTKNIKTGYCLTTAKPL